MSPQLNTAIINMFLEQFSETIPDGEHAVMVWDGAGFHTAKRCSFQTLFTEDCILYRIDPHDRSTELIIARNTAEGTRERHGIIGSRGISNSYIFENTTRENFGSGALPPFSVPG